MTSDPGPVLDVLMPFRDRVRYLRQSVASVLRQTLVERRLILGDNGSIDGSGELARRLAEERGDVTVVDCQGLSLEEVRNRLLERASADFVAWLDSDDLAEPGRLERQLAHLRMHPGCVAVGSDFLVIDEDGDPIRVERVPRDHDSIDEELLTRRGLGMLFPGSTMRRRAVVDVGGFRAGFPVAQDADLLLRLAETGRLANLPETLTRYRWHPGSLSWRAPDRQQALVERATREARRRRGLPSPPEGEEAEEGDAGRGSERTVAAVRLSWASAAMEAGNPATARKHIRRSLLARPVSPRGWRLLSEAVFPLDVPRKGLLRLVASGVRRLLIGVAVLCTHMPGGGGRR